MPRQGRGASALPTRDASGGVGDTDAVVVLPSASFPPPSAEELETLRAVGERWAEALGHRRLTTRVLPTDPDLRDGRVRLRRTSRFERFGQVSDGFLPAGRGTLVATEEAITPPGRLGRALSSARRFLLGPPLTSTAIIHERLSRPVALAVLSSDALSSVAYGTDAMLSVLVLAGTGAFGVSLPIAAVIALLMIVVGASYRQTIRAYPHGGGSYTVASDNLGRLPGLVAAAGLITDYVLTVSVSVAAGVAAITSALPQARPLTVEIAVVLVVAILAANLRGVRQSGALFAAPTYAFVLGILLLVGVGLGEAARRGFTVLPPRPVPAVESLSIFLVLRAFASGCSAMTGIEAISNGVQVFRPPEWRNARSTLTWMVALLVVMFLGVSVLAHLDGATPGAETVLSQLAERTFGRGPLYGYIQATTTLILVLAANTAFSDFPRLLFFLARDRYAPRFFSRVGDRLVYSNGIILLALAAIVLIVAFSGNIDSLIALYAIGVFLAFTLSQAGMVVHWWRRREPGWRWRLAINAVGATLSGAVVLVVATTKFTEGAWLVVVVIPLLVVAMLRIHGHYACAERATMPHRLAPETGAVAPVPRPRPRTATAVVVPEEAESPDEISHLALVPIAWLDLAALRALAYAVSLGVPVLALHVAADEVEADRLRRLWETWGGHLPLEIVLSPYRAVVVPLSRYVSALQRRCPSVTITVVIPELVVRRWWQAILHNQVGFRLRTVLRSCPGVVVATVPFHLRC